MRTENFKITGKVVYAGKERESDKNVVSIKVTPETMEKFKGFLDDSSEYVSTPVKEDKEGNEYIKFQSKFGVDIYEGKELESDYALEEIGKESTVQIFAGLKEQIFKRKKFIVAYVKAISIIDFKEKEVFNAFDSDEVEEV